MHVVAQDVGLQDSQPSPTLGRMSELTPHAVFPSQPSPKLKLSAVALVAANLIPLVGVLFFGWSVRNLLLLYWTENVIVGGFAIARMVSINPAVGLPMGLFFTVHFGMFCFVHLAFVDVLSQPGGPMASTGGSFLPGLGDIVAAATPWAIFGLVVSHGFSFVVNFLLGGERKTSTVPAEMIKPYPRMVVLHVAIVVGAFLTIMIGGGIGVLLVLVVLKIAVDLGLHVAGHRLRQKEPTPPARGKQANWIG